MEKTDIINRPSSKDWFLYTKRGAVSGRMQLVNENGAVIMEDSDSDKEKCRSLIEEYRSEYVKLYAEWLHDKRQRPDEYRASRNYESLDFVEKAERRGFVDIDGVPINTSNNWFGVSVYRPDVWLRNGEKTIRMSLNGLSIPIKYPNCTKYIALFNGDTPVYESTLGYPPTNKELEDFFMIY